MKFINWRTYKWYMYQLAYVIIVHVLIGTLLVRIKMLKCNELDVITVKRM